jgi:UDP-glucuronate decarboxylase
LKTSVLGALFVLDLAKKNKAKVFQASTSEVYGDPIEHPQKESYWGNVNPIGIRSCYDEGKRCAETLFFDYWREYGVKIKVGRIFNTYGPRMRVDDGRVVTNFISQAISGESITVYGKGDQTRSFCYVSDLIDAILLLVNSSDEVTGPINLGNPGEFTMLELASKVIAITNSTSSILFKPLPQDDPKMRKPDLTVTKKTIGWSPKVSLDEGLKATIEAMM